MWKKILMMVVNGMMIVPILGFAAGYNSNICQTDVCTRKEVGPFMEKISQECGNLGDCTLVDIMTVVANVGNFILEIAGAVVLLMYVIGGFHLLLAGVNADNIKKGNQMIKISTIGLVIIMVAYLGIKTLEAGLGISVK